MSTGTGAQPNRGVVVSDITPSIEVPNVADDWRRIAATFDRLHQNVEVPILKRRAERIGSEEGAAIARGEAEYKPVLGWGSVADARNAARETAYLATIRSDMDGREAQIRRENVLNPVGYEKAAGEMVSGFIQGAPSEYAVNVETYARGITQRGLESVAGARVDADARETAQATGVRIGELDEKLVALGSRDGGTESQEYRDAWTERQELQQMRTDNPVINYSSEQRTFDDDRLDDDVQIAGISRLAVSAYGEGGRGMAGYAAGMRFLEDEVLNGEAFADMDPGRRSRLYKEAAKQLRDYTAADREQARATEETERAARAEAREKVGSYRLGILMGDVTEAQINADESLSDAQQAGLISSVRAQAKRDQAEAARDTAAARQANIDNYNQHKDQAQAGTLSDSDLADALNAGQITPGQVRTLKGLRDRGLKPIIDQAMAPFNDMANSPGRSNSPDLAQRRAFAEEAAVQYARAHPDANLSQNMAAGKVIAERAFGTSAVGRPTTARAADQSRAGRIAAVNARIRARAATARPYSQAEQARMRKEALDAD